MHSNTMPTEFVTKSTRTLARQKEVMLEIAALSASEATNSAELESDCGWMHSKRTRYHCKKFAPTRSGSGRRFCLIIVLASGFVLSLKENPNELMKPNSGLPCSRRIAVYYFLGNAPSLYWLYYLSDTGFWRMNTMNKLVKSLFLATCVSVLFHVSTQTTFAACSTVKEDFPTWGTLQFCDYNNNGSGEDSPPNEFSFLSCSSAQANSGTLGEHCCNTVGECG